jgi:hypothetical protein
LPRTRIGIDLDGENVARWAQTPFSAPLELYCCDAVEWLRHRFGWYRVTPGAVAPGGDAVLGAPAGQVAAAGGDGSGGRRSTFVYCDPPYLMSTRSSPGRIYKHEMSEAQHVELLGTLLWVPSLVMISHYPCDLYERMLAGWRHFTFDAITRGGARVTEKVWCNYDPPNVLHDSRYLGGNKRQREKMRRRRRNLAAKLLRLPPLERQALLDEVAITSRQ